MNLQEFMSLPKDEKRIFWKSVECVPDCGNCCGDCPLLTSDKKCSVHPSLPHIGSHLARIMAGGGTQCDMTPIEVFVDGCYCLAIVKKLRVLLPDLEFETLVNEYGVSILNHQEVMDATSSIRGF